MKDKLYRNRTDKKIAGVCGGIAERIDVDSTIVRLVWAFLFLCYGTGFLFYIVAALVIPIEPLNEPSNNKDKIEKEE